MSFLKILGTVGQAETRLEPRDGFRWAFVSTDRTARPRTHWIEVDSEAEAIDRLSYYRNGGIIRRTQGESEYFNFGGGWAASILAADALKRARDRQGLPMQWSTA